MISGALLQKKWEFEKDPKQLYHKKNVRISLQQFAYTNLKHLNEAVMTIERHSAIATFQYDTLLAYISHPNVPITPLVLINTKWRLAIGIPLYTKYDVYIESGPLFKMMMK